MVDLAVVSFKVPKEVKQKMERYKSKVNWAQELREFLSRRLEELEREEVFREVMEELEKLEPSSPPPKGISVQLVREDRASH